MALVGTMTEKMTVGQRIKWARKSAGLSQERLAASLGTTRQVVIRWERDKHLPNSLSRDRLAETLDQEPDFFCEGAALGDPFRGSAGEPAPSRAGGVDGGKARGVREAA